MKELTYLYATFEGRLSRRLFWTAFCGLIAAEVLLALALARTTGVGLRDFAGDRRAAWIMLVVAAFFFWPSLALCVKRLHDRDLPGWWAGLLHVLVFIFYADRAGLRPLIRDQATLLVSLLPAMMLFLVGIWLSVELILLAGTPGSNQFGAAPGEDGALLSASGQSATGQRASGGGRPAPLPGE